MKENIIKVMQEKKQSMLDSDCEKNEAIVKAKAIEASEKAMEEVRRSSQIDPTDILQAQELAKTVQKAGKEAEKIERRKQREALETAKVLEKKGEEKVAWETKIRLEWLTNLLGADQWETGHVDAWTKRTVPEIVGEVNSSFVWVIKYQEKQSKGAEEGWKVKCKQKKDRVNALSKIISQGGGSKVCRIRLTWDIPRR